MTRPAKADWIIIGGGFAGLATACGLAAAGQRGMLFEQEPICGAHASGRNAGIFRLADEDPLLRAMAGRTQRLLAAPPWAQAFQRTGGLTLAGKAGAAAVARRAAAMRREGLAAELLPWRRARRRFPELCHFRGEVVLWCPDEGVIDIHALLTTYRRRAVAGGFTIRTRLRVDEVTLAAGRVSGVRAGDSEVHAACVVEASGAWAGRLGARHGQAPSFQPLRRHLFVIDRPHPWRRGSPFIWTIEPDLYVRPEATGLLASACDESAWQPGVPAVDPSAAERLAETMLAVAPGSGELAMRRVWACLRTFSGDRRPVIGPDAALPGLHYAAGLGGAGVTISGAVAELAATLAGGRPPSWIDRRSLAPGRLAPAPGAPG